MKAKLDSLGLTAISVHHGLPDLRDHFDEIVAYNKVLGNDNIVCAWAPFESWEQVQAQTAELAALADKLEACGMKLHYHNHSHEFVKFEQDGGRYHHILDPKTGHPAASGLQSVSVVSQDDTLADALSTALFVMGLDAGAALYRAGDLAFEAVFMTDDGSVWITPGLAGQYQSDRPYQVLQP